MKKIDKILQHLENQGINIANFERESDISNGYFANTVKRGADITEKILEKIRKKQPKIYATVFAAEKATPMNQPTPNNEQMDNASNSQANDWKQAHDELMAAHKIYAQSHAVLSNALATMTDLLKDVRDIKTNLTDVAKKQQTFRVTNGASQRIALEILADLKGLNREDVLNSANSLKNALLKLDEDTDTPVSSDTLDKSGSAGS